MFLNSNPQIMNILSTEFVQLFHRETIGYPQKNASYPQVFCGFLFIKPIKSWVLPKFVFFHRGKVIKRFSTGIACFPQSFPQENVNKVNCDNKHV